MRFSKLQEKIYPLPPIGGLEISDSVIRLAELVKGNPSGQAYRLPPGVIEAGKVKNKAGLVAVLKELIHKSPNRGKLGIVLTIPSSSVFIQTVKLPPAASANLEEAASLNVQMVSPLKQGEFYYDWQRVGSQADGGPIELLAAFVSRDVVDGFADCLREAGLGLIAVEFTSLSLTRELRRRKVVEAGKVYLAAEIMPEGTTFMLMQGSQLLFHSFRRLGVQTGQQIAVADFIATLKEEVQDIINFHLAHWGGVVNDLIFISAGFQNEIQGAFRDKTVTILNPDEVMPVLGAVYRPILPASPRRGERVEAGGEKVINLLGTSSLKIYEANRALTFVSLWRTVLVSALGFLLVLALGTDLFLRQLAKKATEVSALTLNEPGHRELLALREEATRFNELVSLIKEASQGEKGIGRVAETVNNLAGVEISITRFYLPSLEDPVTINGVAASEQAAVAFKNRLAAEKSFTAVDLPISSIAPETGGRVSFTVYLKIADTEILE